MQDLIVDSEFSLIPPLSAEEYSQLEENILRDGIQDALKIWQGILIDGHNRYEIAKKHDLNFEVSRVQFENRDTATEWIIKNQFGRRNLSAYDLSILALKLKPVIAAKAKENQGERTDLTSVRNLTNVDTKKEIAKAAGVSHDTIAKVEKIEESATPEIKAAVKSGEISINAAYEGVKAGAETVSDIVEIKQADKKPFVVPGSGNNERYTPKEYIDAAGYGQY